MRMGRVHALHRPCGQDKQSDFLFSVKCLKIATNRPLTGLPYSVQAFISLSIHLHAHALIILTCDRSGLVLWGYRGGLALFRL